MGNEILKTTELQLRITDLEYQNLPTDEIIKEVHRIYLEEVGEVLPADVAVFHSSEAPNLSDDKSGYDGTAVYFHSEENNINEVYVISQGSQGAADWEYNLQSIFTGLDYGQAEMARDFVADSLKHFGVDSNEDTTVIGLSHSLGSNNNTTAFLAFGSFDKIYGFNGAQPSYYQLYQADADFVTYLEEIYPILQGNPDAIYDINPKELEKLAEEYYADRAEDIYQVVSTDDPLYWLSGARGFFTIGEVEYIDTNPNYDGLRTLVDKIPDHVIQSIQSLAIDYTKLSKDGGVDMVLKDMLGVDMTIINEIDGFGSAIGAYFFNAKEIDSMVESVNEKLPNVLENIQIITGNADIIFGELMKADYISKKQKDALIVEFKNIEENLLKIQDTVGIIHGLRENASFSAVIGGDIGAYFAFKKAVESLQKSLEKLNKDEYKEILKTIGKSHSISEMLESLNFEHKSYIGTDMLLPTTYNGNKIQVNISAAIRIYKDGKSLLDKKSIIVKKLEKSFEDEIFNCLEEEIKEIKNRINDMEQNPSSQRYKSLLQRHISFSRNKVITKIAVHEVFYPMKNVDINSVISALNESVETGYTYIKEYKKMIESIFEEEEDISNYFKSLGEY